MIIAGLRNSSHFIGIQAAATSLSSTSYVSEQHGGVSSVILSSIVDSNCLLHFYCCSVTPFTALFLNQVALPCFKYSHFEPKKQSVFIFFTGV